MGSHSLLQEFFPTQGSHLGLLHCRRILYHLSHQGRPGGSTVCRCSVTKSCPTLCDPMDSSTPGCSVLHQVSLLKFMSSESVMPSNHLILCHPFSSCLQSFPASGSFLISLLFTSGGPGIGASASVLPMNIQGLFPLGWTAVISLQSK